MTMSIARLAMPLLSAGLMLTPAHDVACQQPPALAERFFSDSTLWDRVLQHVVRSLSTYLVRTSVDSNPQPWHLTLPDDAPDRDRLLRQLRIILRARPVRDSDTLVFTLRIGPLTVGNDTARVTVTADFARRCRGTAALAGFSYSDNVIVQRYPQAGWGAAKSAGAIAGDRVSPAGCRGPW
jgi:hypothetical protein